MTTKEIHETLNEMSSNPKTKNFLSHLITAYYPIEKVDKVWMKPKDTFKCVITKDELFSSQDILEGIRTEEFQKDFMENLKSVFNLNFDTTHPIVKLVGERKMGVTGTNTTTFMSYSTLEDFHSWIITKLLNGDKHITWLLNPKKDKKKENNTEVKTSSGFTLGELDSFKKLYDKFK
jgi:hypothetical protein